MQRLTLLLIPGLIAIALFTGISTFESISTRSEDDLELVELDFNAYSEGINTVLYDVQGSINYTLSAVRQVHYNDDTTELEKPFIRLFRDGESYWNIVASSGKISSADGATEQSIQSIDLSGDVEVYSLDEFGNKMVLSTDYLSIDPQLETLQTDHPVTFVTETMRQSSIGMFADLTIDEIIFHEDVRGSYAQPGN